jgi:hypothetical protein
MTEAEITQWRNDLEVCLRNSHPDMLCGCRECEGNFIILATLDSVLGRPKPYVDETFEARAHELLIAKAARLRLKGARP